MRIGGCLGRAGAEHHAHQRVFGEGRGRASCASAGVWGGQGPSIMRISGSGELQIQSNPSPTKLNFVGLAKNNPRGEERGGEGVLQVIRIRIERTLTGKQQL